MTDARPHSASLGLPVRLWPPSVPDASAPIVAAEERNSRRMTREKEFSEFLDRHWSWLCACARGHLKSTQDAEDLVQDVLLKAWAKDVIDEFGGNDCLIRAYLLRMIENGAIDVYRARGRDRTLSTKYSSFRWRRRAPDTPEENLIAKELKQAIDRALRQLPELEREAFRLVRVLRTPYAVVAEHLHINVNTLSAQLTETYRHVLDTLVAGGHLPNGHGRRKRKEDRS